jgi:putative addiction module component
MPEASLPTPPGFDALSKADQVRYLQALWDQISDDPDALPVPESHLQLVEERLKRFREDPSRGHSAFEVLDRLSSTANTNDKSE